MSNSLLKNTLLRSTMLVGAAFYTVPALAQAVTSEATVETASEEEIVVTGSLIRNPNLESSSPVSVIGQEEIELQQANVAEELLRELPGATPSIGSAVNNGNGGASFVNLRNMGSNRNIVLLDGQRIAPSNFVGRVDLNNIPLALVQRTEVLTGGASTTYGADAISGVVNFITRKDFAGAEINVSEQITEEGDGNRFRADL
ncbi:MAG: TonB-dependent receptor plug domain-containing protein, partial [Sphingomonadaceae bacterium]|nr:TonB-dependent receptor plug domain-containing protein [Sphingomonadaceae bacterium]